MANEENAIVVTPAQKGRVNPYNTEDILAIVNGGFEAKRINIPDSYFPEVGTKLYLHTITWNRVSNSPVNFQAIFVKSSIFDPTAPLTKDDLNKINEYYCVSRASQGVPLLYIKKKTTGSYPSVTTSGYDSLFINPTDLTSPLDVAEYTIGSNANDLVESGPVDTIIEL